MHVTDASVERGAQGGVATGTVSVPPAVGPFLAVGVAAVVAGGVAAAVVRPAGWERGSWVAAFLVLVVGVGQAGLAIGQSAAVRGGLSRRTIVAELGLGNGGASLVIVGTLWSSPLIATVGSLLFGATIALFARHSHRSRGHRGWMQRSYLALLVVLMASVPIGIALSWLRA